MTPRQLAATLGSAVVLCSWFAAPQATRSVDPWPQEREGGQEPEPQPRQRRGMRQQAREVFTTSEACGVCHTTAPGANAMRSPSGDDVSPYELWQGTMMANAFRDPYFRAQLRKETAAAGEEVQELCLRCHAPMAWHGAVLAGGKPLRLAHLADDPYAQGMAEDGVSCTVCHQITAERLGEPSSFSGRPAFGTERRIFGPYADPATAPMQNQVRYTPTHGLHVQRAAVCATCHTLYTEHGGKAFAEQTPYFEWRNSEFTDENGTTATSRTCQQCHMPKVGATRIARNPQGFDFVVPVREDFAAHAFVGGNAFMLDVLRDNRDELDVLADPEALSRMAMATRRQLGEATARLTISEMERVPAAAAPQAAAGDGTGAGGGQDVAVFSVRIENLTGHKFPTGYPARRAWLHVQVRAGRRVVFECGAADEQGRLVGVADEQALPHVRTVTSPADVAVYEMAAGDPAGARTTLLTHMVSRLKDNRLLPRGWRADGPHVDETAPTGVDGDGDFGAGGDTVQFRVPLPANARGRLQVVAWLHYQAVPPAWVDALRGLPGEECARFVRMYDAADKTPETVAVGLRSER